MTNTLLQRIRKITLLVSLTFLVPAVALASVIDTVRGYILLQVEENGEAWYVDPSNDVRYFLGRPDEAFDIMQERGLGITNADLATIPIAGTAWDAPADMRERVRGRILLQVEAHGEAWESKRYVVLIC